ncbi:hypothetical protein CN157_19450 [Sinorhizobium meliloti]|nr:hypothetical protein CN210_14790 [Sinorhizobium meliloti]RVK74504.1 hypothetical protein CN157_19450 [Sinorhizobium meliloti]RVM18994.1 hypothetical protein CN142_02945 [Sinorhizobium meliloti]RVQ76945.1 hypothetical protein CN061_10655 [Sinorhizobium meliloti]
MRTKWNGRPAPSIKVLGVALTDDDGWIVSAAGPAFLPKCMNAGELGRVTAPVIDRIAWQDHGL